MQHKMKPFLLVVLMLTMVLGSAASSWAKTDPGDHMVDSVLFYVLNDAGEQILLSQIPVRELVADLAEDTPVANYSLLDRYVTTVHQEARGYTIDEFVVYARAKSSLPQLRVLPLYFGDDDTIGFWSMDSSDYGLLNTYTGADLNQPRYNFPRLYEYWNYTTQDYADPQGQMNREEVIEYIWAGRETAETQLSVLAFSERFMVSRDQRDAGYMMENFFSGRKLLDEARIMRLMKPMTEAELRNKVSTTNDTRYWIWNILLDMAVRPSFGALGEVAAPTGYLTEDEDYYYLNFYCETEGATIYFNHNLDMESYMPTYAHDPDDLLAVAKNRIKNGSLTINAHAVKEGHTDAGVVSLKLSVSEQAPSIQAEEGYVLGQDLRFPIGGGLAGWDNWLAGLTVSVNGNALAGGEYQITQEALTLSNTLFANAGYYTVTLSSAGFDSQTLEGIRVYYGAPTISAASILLGQPVVFQFADQNYQRNTSVRMKAVEEEDSAYLTINASRYLERDTVGQLTIKADYFADYGLTAGSYSFELSNSAYWPLAAEVVVNLQSAAATQITVGAAEATAGGTVQIPVMMSGNSGFAAFSLQIGYDQSALMLTGVTPGSLLSDHALFYQTANGVSWSSGNAQNSMGDGELLRLTFQVAAGANGNYPVRMALYEDNPDNFSAVGAAPAYPVSPVAVEFIAGQVAVTGSGVILGDLNGDSKINSQDLTLLRRYVAKLNTFSAEQLQAADLNGDSKVNSQDLTLLRRYVAKLITGFSTQ